MKWNAFQNEFSNLFLLFYWIKELILVLQLFSFAFKFVQTIMYCICIVAKPNHVILYIQNQSCPRNWEFCCELPESEWNRQYYFLIENRQYYFLLLIPTNLLKPCLPATSLPFPLIIFCLWCVAAARGEKRRVERESTITIPAVLITCCCLQLIVYI